MDDLVTRKELAKRWKCSEDAIIKTEAAGYLPSCPHVPGVKYRMADVYRCEGGVPCDPLSPLERKRLLDQLKEKDEAIRVLKEKIQKAAESFFDLNMEVTKNEVSK